MLLREVSALGTETISVGDVGDFVQDTVCAGVREPSSDFESLVVSARVLHDSLLGDSLTVTGFVSVENYSYRNICVKYVGLSE